MHGRDILLIDDDPDLLEGLGLILRKQGYRVETAPDGDNGARLAMRDKPDLIILDIMMPGKDGIAVGEELLESAGTMLIPVIILTGFDDGSKRKKAEALGAVGYMTKPFDEKELLSAIRRILG